MAPTAEARSQPGADGGGGGGPLGASGGLRGAVVSSREGNPELRIIWHQRPDEERSVRSRVSVWQTHKQISSLFSSSQHASDHWGSVGAAGVTSAWTTANSQQFELLVWSERTDATEHASSTVLVWKPSRWPLTSESLHLSLLRERSQDHRKHLLQHYSSHRTKHLRHLEKRLFSTLQWSNHQLSLRLSAQLQSKHLSNNSFISADVFMTCSPDTPTGCVIKETIGCRSSSTCSQFILWTKSRRRCISAG